MKKTICLNMIVKNENKIIKRCLASVKSIINYWVIIDTGSTDGTQETIREFMQDVPGELHEYPWVDFAHNRNQALALSKNKGDYLLFIDADEQLIFHESFDRASIHKDYYFFLVQQPNGINYFRESLIGNHLDWIWEGPVHETLRSSQAKTSALMPGITKLSNTAEGHRSQDPHKYLRDAAILEQALEKDPHNSRYVFYLALSYGNAKEHEKAKKFHEKRVSMEGSEQEIFYSLLSIAKIQDHLAADPDTVINSYTKAYLYRPSRAEPLYFLANYYTRRGNFTLSYLMSKKGLEIKPTEDMIFVQHEIYNTGLLLQFADASVAIGSYLETLSTYDTLLKKTTLSIEQRKNIEKNILTIKTLG
ncbi:MAG: glycosyltransferase [Silvanigrellaceae bacterium]|nr:glycosyltransferase [Silvanigrellaceae bacterium]